MIRQMRSVGPLPTRQESMNVLKASAIVGPISAAALAVGLAYWYHKTGNVAELGGGLAGAGFMGVASSVYFSAKHLVNLRRN